MRFIVKFRSDESPTASRYPYAVLVQDNWDDYGYKTTFQVTLHLSADESYDLGSIKIIQAERSSGYTEMPKRPFRELPAGHASLGADLDYYETIYKLGRDVFEPYLTGLRDVAFDDDIKASVEDTEAYQVSLLRFSGAKRTIADAARLLRADALPARRRSAGFKVKFKTQVARNSNAFTIEFDSALGLGAVEHLRLQIRNLIERVVRAEAFQNRGAADEAGHAVAAMLGLAGLLILGPTRLGWGGA